MNDKEIARKYLITSLTIKNLELDLHKIQNSTLKVKTGDIQREIQVTYLYTQGDFSTYKFVLNRNEEDVTYMNQKLKKDVESQIKYLLTIRK